MPVITILQNNLKIVYFVLNSCVHYCQIYKTWTCMVSVLNLNTLYIWIFTRDELSRFLNAIVGKVTSQLSVAADMRHVNICDICPRATLIIAAVVSFVMTNRLIMWRQLTWRARGMLAVCSHAWNLPWALPMEWQRIWSVTMECEVLRFSEANHRTSLNDAEILPVHISSCYLSTGNNFRVYITTSFQKQTMD